MTTADGNPPRWALACGERYVTSVILTGSGYHRGAAVDVAFTYDATKALRLCTEKNANRVAYLVNLHEVHPHKQWKVIKL